MLPATEAQPIDPQGMPLSYFLGVLGMPGMTAYAALLGIGQPKPGETVLISAAAGAVGQLAGQIAKLRGCRVIGIAGAPDKIAYIRDELGFDAAVDYKGKEASALGAELASLAPDGIHVFIDNVGGAVHDAVMANLALHARIAIVAQWPLLTVACGVLIALAGALTVVFAPRWSAMATRYEAPTAAARRDGPATDIALWTALDRGEDPTTRT